MTVPAALVAFTGIVACAAAIWLQVVHTIRHPEPIAVPPRPHVAGVVWGHRVYVDVATFRGVLTARGVSYAGWARKHPAAAKIIRGNRTRHH